MIQKNKPSLSSERLQSTTLCDKLQTDKDIDASNVPLLIA